MNKTDFLESLNKRLYGLPQDDITERLTFYSEMIDDSIEEGVPEEEAISQIGSVDEIVSQIIAEIHNSKFLLAQKTKGKFTVWEILLLVLGSPIWISLLIAAFAVIFVLYISLWSVIISMWAVFASIISAGIGIIISSIIFIIKGNALSGVAMIGAGLFSLGFGILIFCACKYISVFILTFTKHIFKKIKNRLFNKGEIK